MHFEFTPQSKFPWRLQPFAVTLAYCSIIRFHMQITFHEATATCVCVAADTCKFYAFFLPLHTPKR